MRRHAPVFLLLPLIILSCASAERNPRSQVASVDNLELPAGQSVSSRAALEQAQRLEASNQLVAAALAYTKLAASVPPPNRQAFALRAANLFHRANLTSQANQILQDTDWASADTGTQFERGLLGARIALADRDSKGALAVLDALELGPEILAPQKIEYRSLRIRAFDLAGDIGASLREHVMLENLLTSPADINGDQQAIANLLAGAPGGTLQEIVTGASSPELRGWAELGLVLRQSPDRTSLTAAITEWRSRNPGHPITTNTLDSLAPIGSDRLANIASIGLLLPLDGPTASSAAAVRDGFLAAYYAQPATGAKPAIKVYNTGPNGENVLAAYQQAVSEGVSVAVGPLHKAAIEALAGLGRLSVPTLALNEITTPATQVENLFQFGLSPDNEARQVAERAWADGATQAVILYPSGAWGERLSQAFRQRWQQLGGAISASEVYQADKNDYSPPLKKILGIDESNNRAHALANVVAFKPKSEPRLRRDLEFIFLAAYPVVARQIMPQLLFYQAGHIPVYSTSHPFTGVVDKKADSDINNLIVGDMPWTLAGTVGPQAVRDKVTTIWKGNMEQQARLYALGVDAHNVLPYLGWLQGNPSARWQGVTGILSLDQANHITRQLSWAKIVSGAPKLLSGLTPPPSPPP